MKVGVDGVLVGAWGEIDGKKGLDIGCGCGLIALMAAQRNSLATIDAIDIDADSVEEAGNNFTLSPWPSRLSAMQCDAADFSNLPDRVGTYDFILSNPPFFASGVSNPHTAREIARHQSVLSPNTLVEFAERLLKHGGTLSFIMPSELPLDVEDTDYKGAMNIKKICLVSDRKGKAPKRKLITLIKGKAGAPLKENLYVKGGSESLTAPFYL